MKLKHILKFGLPAALVGVLGIVAWENRANDTSDQIFTIGVLHPTRVDIATVEGFRSRLSELGYQEGLNVRFVYDGPAGRGKKLTIVAHELVAQDVDLIFASSTPATQAAKAATKDTGIPVVFGPVNDPVGAKIIDSLRHPGGNITGVTLPASGGKRLEWLAGIGPEIQNILVPFNPDNKSSVASLNQAKIAAPNLGVSLLPHPVHNAEELHALLGDLPDQAHAIFLPRDAMITGQIDKVHAAALAHGVPLSAPGLIQVEAGALMSYGFVHSQVGRIGAELAVKIINGAAPGDTPVEIADSHLFLNLRTANLLGVEFSDGVLRQASVILR